VVKKARDSQFLTFWLVPVVVTEN